MSSFAFVSFDGPDNNGQRAEVHVSVSSEGTVQSLKDGPKGEVSRVEFKTEKLKYAQAANVRKDDPVYPVLVDALENGTPVSYRIESQRKSNVDRALPIAELRADSKVAIENTKSILAAVNGILTSEAVTNPKEDPQPSGRHKATDEVVASVQAQRNQSQPNQSRSGSSANEEKPWEQYNSDGRINLGSYAITGLVSAESTAREHLVETEVVNIDDFLTDAAEGKVEYLTRALLRIADAVQVAPDHADGGSARPNRAATSHGRARGIVYDSLKYLPFSKDFDKEAVKDWEAKVEALATRRFVFAASLALDVPRAPETASRREEPQNTPQERREQPREQVSEAGTSNASKAKFYEPSSEDLSGPKAEEETVEMFIHLFKESGLERASDLTPLIERTFGVKNVREVADTALDQFVEFYDDKGMEAFVEAVQVAKASA